MEGGQTHKLQILDVIGSAWHDAALSIGLGNDAREDYAQKYPSNKDRMIQVLKKWIEVDGTGDYPMSWEGLIELLKDIEQTTVAEDLKKALVANGIPIV